MKIYRNTFSSACKASSIIMMVTLLWLTVSTPFVYAAQANKAKVEKQQCEKSTEEDCSKDIGNTTEEKSEKGISSLSEYLHDFHSLEAAFTNIVKVYKCHPSDLYFSFHPDLFSPPPDA